MRRSLVCALFTVFSFTFGVQAALPFLTAEQRMMEASDIVEGRVTKVIETNKVKHPGYSDYRYEVEMVVEQVLKGVQTVGTTMTFHFWTVAERPEGMCGDNGQFIDSRNGLVIRAGKTIRTYTYEGEKGHQLLKPNGFDMIQTEPENLYMVIDRD